MEYRFKIFRFDPLRDEEAYFQEFLHKPGPKDSILEAIKDIRDQQDPSLSFRYSCREAVCGSCAMVINGHITLACKTTVESLNADEIVIEPLPNLEVQKDLIVDMEPFFKAMQEVEPYLLPNEPAPEKGYRIEEREMERIYQFITCIQCGCCFSACPVASRDSRYLGPAALAKLCRFVCDPRDKRSYSSWAKVDSPEGVWGCDTVFRCNEVCPKSVRPADGIMSLRRKLVAGKVMGKKRKEK